MGYGRIASQIGRPTSTIQNFIQCYIERGAHENKQRLGWQKNISKATEDVLSLIEVKEALADALTEIWNGIPESLLESLYTSMPHRVAAVTMPGGTYPRPLCII